MAAKTSFVGIEINAYKTYPHKYTVNYTPSTKQTMPSRLPTM